jgi:hypothetical protein
VHGAVPAVVSGAAALLPERFADAVEAVAAV